MIVAASVTRPEIEERAETGSELAPRYHLILLDDNEHTYDYVIELLGRIFGYGKEKAFALARLVDTQGQVIVETADYDQVSLHQQQIHAYGPDRRIRRCKGSMSAVIEPAD
ncbi:MAG TPA: ATP-dependent Clp protease adaptor ClpS [Dehalococcoidia bacterium]|nr:ATP-dependent Clp protease adaptor ClpS [Dehalococcoidia bacterium]